MKHTYTDGQNVPFVNSKPRSGSQKSSKSAREIYPLYEHLEIAYSDEVIFVEEEQSAQSLIDQGFCATTLMQGDEQALNKTDWGPLDGKEVLIWPKRNKQGWKFAFEISQSILRAGSTSCSILVPPADKPSGWDAFDAVAEGFDVSGFLRDAPRQPMVAPWQFKDLSEPIKGIDYTTEDGVAKAFTYNFSQDVRFCGAWAKWLNWSGKRWEMDGGLHVKHLARLVCCSAAEFTNKPHLKARLTSASAFSSIERIVRADPQHHVRVDQLDANEWLLNTPGGIVDLQTGVLGPHVRERHMTRITNATPGGDCSVWRGFLADVTGGDEEMQNYLQRMVGYCLTGNMSTHALFFLHGTGANGKTVFVNVISSVLGSYAATAPMDAFMHSYSDRHPTELAGLRGARFVTAIETEQGRRWNESRIKAITGGDVITARLMHQDFFTYKPQFKLLIAGNHKPEIRNIDEALRRRLHLIPFTITVAPEKRDPHLTEKLLAERDGILAWAVEGCRKWRKLGLQKPNKVAEATQEYFESEDSLGAWMTERCKFGTQERSLSATLFNDWKQWAEASGEFVGTQRRFSAGLMARRFEKWRDSMGFRGYRGLDLKQPTAQPTGASGGSD